MAGRQRSSAKVGKAKEFGIALERLEKKTNKKMLRHMRRSAHEVEEQVKKNVPKRSGALESSVEVMEKSDGPHGRTVFEVTVDEDTLLGNIGHHQSYPFAYHEVHEAGENDLVTFTYKRRPRGKGYMRRALDKLGTGIRRKAREIFDESQLQF